MDIFLDLTSGYFLITLLCVSFSTGFITGMGGSGGLLLVPFMITAGIPPALALGTARFAAMPAWVLAVRNYHSAGKVNWKNVYIFSLLGIIAGSIGTLFIVQIDEKYIYPIVGIILVILAPLGLIKKNFGLIAYQRSKISHTIGYILYFFAMIYAGFFGSGASLMLMFIMVGFLGFKSLEAHATWMAAWLPMSLFSSIIFFYHGQINFIYAIFVCIGTLLGSHFGSKLAIKNGDKFVKWLVCSFAFIIGIKLLFFTA